MVKGVYGATKKDGTQYYRASITYRKKHISLGGFETETMANMAYLEADRLINDKSIIINMHNEESALSFEKWVIIINFRDNGIYFNTPIYARSRFFYYYLSKEDVLKFDMDELFYYSSHKIMRRNGHLFVADYGMQVNILNRYGIRNFAVPGKDYIFLNGDDMDFRHENLSIVNVYFGVEKVTLRGKERYRARINIPGYYIIGHYHSEIEAAVAYNKAIDILKRNGIKKNYTPNYVDGISPSEYAEIYSRLKISDKIYNYGKQN
jgi:hypothetical protein